MVGLGVLEHLLEHDHVAGQLLDGLNEKRLEREALELVPLVLQVCDEGVEVISPELELFHIVELELAAIVVVDLEEGDVLPQVRADDGVRAIVELALKEAVGELLVESEDLLNVEEERANFVGGEKLEEPRERREGTSLWSSGSG